MAQTNEVLRATVSSPRCKAFPARALNQAGDPIVFYKGAIVAKRIDSDLVEIPEAAFPRTDLIPLGIVAYTLDMTGKANGDCSVVVEPGNKRDFKTGTGANEITPNHVGQTWYLYDDETAYLTSDGGTLSPGGTIVFVDEDEYNGATNVVLHFDYEQVQVLSGIAAINNSLESSLGHIDLSPANFVLLTGAPLAAFANGASAVPGTAIVDSKLFAIRWNNNATLDGVLASFRMPEDCDIAANMIARVYASKTGATLADAPTFAIGAYNQVVGALHDADANFGGTTGAMTGDAAAKTEQAVSVTLALANLAASPAGVTLTVKPTDGTLGTDDLVMHGVRIYYTKKLVAAS